MDARSAMQWIVTILVVVVGVSFPVFAGQVSIYGGDFNTPLLDPIGPGSSLTEVIIEVPDDFIVSDLDVRISITHTNVFDLQIFLQSPAGTRICLNMYNLREFFEAANYTRTIFDDEAQLSIEQAEPPFTGRFRPRAIDPRNLLDIFDRESVYGPWRLQIYDMWPVDTGTLDSFELVITAPEPATAILLLLGTALITLLNPRRT
ncbi:MAG TPA: proprotein convertase P-domain-containing protein [Sedimentisphaerales bacterium]|nr:proprotein convertase P-domain-containing protein [Sedimentisphaerales bacterium]